MYIKKWHKSTTHFKVKIAVPSFRLEFLLQRLSTFFQSDYAKVGLEHLTCVCYIYIYIFFFSNGRYID